MDHYCHGEGHLGRSMVVVNSVSAVQAQKCQENTLLTSLSLGSKQ